MITHNSKTKIRWDLLIIFFAVWNCISIPFNVCFPEAQFDKNFGMVVLERIIDVAFFLDICVNFLTSFISEKTGMEVIDLKKIAQNYVFAGRFWIDILASIPFEIIFAPLISASDSGNNGFALKLLGLLKLVRLLRLGRMISYMKVNQSLKLGFRVFQLLFFLILLVHWIGCLFYQFVQSTNSWLAPKDL